MLMPLPTKKNNGIKFHPPNSKIKPGKYNLNGNLNGKLDGNLNEKLSHERMQKYSFGVEWKETCMETWWKSTHFYNTSWPSNFHQGLNQVSIQVSIRVSIVDCKACSGPGSGRKLPLGFHIQVECGGLGWVPISYRFIHTCGMSIGTTRYHTQSPTQRVVLPSCPRSPFL